MSKTRTFTDKAFDVLGVVVTIAFIAIALLAMRSIVYVLSLGMLMEPESVRFFSFDGTTEAWVVGCVWAIMLFAYCLSGNRQEQRGQRQAQASHPHADSLRKYAARPQYSSPRRPRRDRNIK